MEDVYRGLSVPNQEARKEPSSANHPNPSRFQTNRYLKCIDKFFNSYVSCFVTGSNAKFLLLHQPAQQSLTAGRMSANSIATNPTGPATEEAIRNFFVEVYESWVKAIMSPFYKVNMEIKSPVFRSRVAAAGKKYL